MLRREGDRIVARVDGRPVWPIHHATRSAVPPWDELVGLLMSAAPRPLPLAFGPDLRRPLDAFPGLAFLPRVTAGALVISAAQWRIGRAELWPVDAPMVLKARRLDALRARLGLPRWVGVTDPRRGGSIGCDLESLRAIRTFDRVLGEDAETVTVAEALPVPTEHPVTDGAGARHAAQLMLRLPADATPDDLARSAASAVHAAPTVTAVAG